MPKRETSLSPQELNTLGDLICFLRERAMLTQRDLAARVGYHYSYISRIEKNQHTPTIATLMGRFIPALELESDTEWTQRLIKMASPRETIEPAAHAREQAIHDKTIFRPPISLTVLLGREDEIDQISTSLQKREVRLLTLIGPPGVGKTRLALHIAQQFTNHFSHGAVFVNLSPISNYQTVLATLGQALDVHASSDLPIQDVLETFLQNKNLLIVLDNFEQVLSAAPMLIEILNRAPGVKIMATSREALHVPGEYEYHIEPLPLPVDSQAQSFVLMKSPAIQLFVQRASAVNSTFTLTEENASSIAEVCHRLDGLPLAIELAAARIQTLSPAAMLQQFERRFNWLSRGRNDLPASRQTLSGAISWSYQLLSEPERILFQRLAIFENSWDLEAVEKICSDEANCPPSEIFNLLLQLSDRSLVVVDAREDGTRYRYLETIRHFAREKLEQSDELTGLRDRHLHHFTEWAEQMEALMTRMPPLEFRHSVEQEYNNIQTALDWALTNESANEIGFRLTASISVVWLKLSYYKQALEWVEKFLPLTDTTHKKQRARLLYLKAALLYWRDQLTISLVSGLEAEAQARELGDQKLLANILYYLGGCIYRELGDYDKAVSCLEEGIGLCRTHRLPSRLSLALSSFAAILFHQWKKEEAQSMVDEALQIAVRENDLWGQGYAFRVHADFLRGEHKFFESMELYERAFNIAQSIDDRISMGMELANMSLLANMMEDFQVSGQHAEAALSIFQAIGNDYQQPFPQRMIAYSALHENNLPRARSFCLESLRGNHKLGHTTGVLACLLALAAIETAAGNESLAASLFGHVREQLEQQSLQLMEPDGAVLQKLEKEFAGKADIPIPELSIPDLIRDLNLGN